MTTENKTDENLGSDDSVRQIALVISDVNAMKKILMQSIVASKAADTAEFDSVANPSYLKGSMEMIVSNLEEAIELWEKNETELEADSHTFKPKPNAIPFNEMFSTSAYELKAFFNLASKNDWDETGNNLNILSLGTTLLEGLNKKLCSQVPEQYIQNEKL